MADLQFNLKEMKTAADEYRSVADDMEKIKEQLKKRISNLRDESWVSTAGKKFQDIYDDQWSKNVEQYITVLRQYASMLDDARQEYSKLKEEADRIQF